MLNAADLQARLVRSLHLALDESDMSQHEAAERLRIRRQEFNAMINGRRRISENTLLRLIDEFGHDPAWWYTDHRAAQLAA